MGIRADSYSSTSEVKAFVMHLMDGQSTWNSTTRPTGPQVEKFIDRASGMLNLALVGAGFSAPVTNSTAKLACDDWVTQRATEYVELTQRGVGYSDAEGSRTASFSNLAKRAADFVAENKQGFIRLGVTQGYKLSDGLLFTGMDAAGQRSDPGDSSLAQPKFTRDLFDNPTVTHFHGGEDDE